MPDVKVDDITNALRQRIVSGEFGTGGRLPSLRMFAEQYGTTRESMNKVAQRLQAEGLLSSLGTAGVFVRASRARIPGIGLRVDRSLHQLGLEPIEATIGHPEVIPASRDVATALAVPEQTPVVRRLQRQGTATAHYRLVETFSPHELAGGSILERLQEDEHVNVLQAMKDVHRKAVKRVHEDVIGRLPTPEEQDLLKIVRSTPVLEVHRTYVAEDDMTVLLYSRLILVASYFVLSYDYTAPEV